MSGRPRLLYVVTLAEVGGAQSYVRDLLPAVCEQYDVTLAAHGEGPLRAAATEHGIAFVPLRHVRRPLSVIQDPLGVGELTRLFRRVRPDIVHLNSSKAGVLGRIAASAARVPVRVFTAHGWAFKATTGAAARAYALADRAVCPLTTMIVCVSQTELEAGLAARVCVPERTTVIPNAVDVSAVPTPSVGASEPVQIVSVGRLAVPKDFSTLLEALALLPRGRAGLTVLGDGPLRPALGVKVAELGLAGDVVFAGEVADVRPYLDRAQVFVLSSTSEGMPISVLEAMAAGLPVVASAVGGLHEIVVDGATGLLVPPSQPQALAETLEGLIEDAELRGRLGAAGRQRAEDEFSLQRWRAAHLDLYASLLAAAS